MFCNNALKKFRAQDKLGALPNALNKIIHNWEQSDKKWAKRMLNVRNMLKSKTKATLLMLPFLAIMGGLTKQTITRIDRLGSKEYSVNKKDYSNKEDYKAAKK